jgi:hypothetical protein
MLRPSPPMSNSERQQRFQDAHPGYDRRRKARGRAAAKRGAAQMLEALRVAAAESRDAEMAPAEALAAPVPVAIPVMSEPTTPRLCLPAPVVDPMIAEINALRARLGSLEACAALPVRPSSNVAPVQTRAA